MSDLSAMFSAMKQKPDARASEHPGVRASEQPVSRAGGKPNVRTSEEMAVQATGKRSHPDYEKVTVYLRKSTHKNTRRMHEDQSGTKDYSELVQQLLDQYERSGGRMSD